MSLFSNAQIINFPDANFKAKLLSANVSNTIASTNSPIYSGMFPFFIDFSVSNYNVIDVNGDNEIQVTEALAIKYLNVGGSNISDLTGIAAFLNLEAIVCENNLLTSLDFSGLNNLNSINCLGNVQLSNLNVTQNLALKNLFCFVNQLTSLNVSQNLALELLNCSGNQLVSLDVSNNPVLKYLDCSVNQLTNLAVSNNTYLEEMYCQINQLTNLNVSQNTNLNALHCENNLLNTIQFGSLNTIVDLVCSNNQLTNLNLNQFPNLETIEAGNNQLQSIAIKNGYNNSAANNAFFDFGGNPNLQYICVDEVELNGIQSQVTQYGYTNCQVNSYCNFTPGGTYYTINGQNKIDTNNNGCDVSDAAFSNLKFSITDGTTSGTLISNETGNYAINVQAGTHTITPILENPSYFTIFPTNVVVNFPTQTGPLTQNFCITPNGIHNDVEVSLLPTNVARPGFDSNYKIIYKNKGNQIENGTINFQFDDAVLDVVATNPVFTTQTANNLSFNYSNL